MSIIEDIAPDRKVHDVVEVTEAVSKAVDEFKDLALGVKEQSMQVNPDQPKMQTSISEQDIQRNTAVKQTENVKSINISTPSVEDKEEENTNDFSIAD